MSAADKPWTFEPLEVDHEPTWTIYDPNLARIVATFHDEDEAADYLRWRNKKQAKKKARDDTRRGKKQARDDTRGGGSFRPSWYTGVWT